MHLLRRHAQRVHHLQPPQGTPAIPSAGHANGTVEQIKQCIGTPTRCVHLNLINVGHCVVVSGANIPTAGNPVACSPAPGTRAREAGRQAWLRRPRYRTRSAEGLPGSRSPYKAKE
jgi:hypothetical protein